MKLKMTNFEKIKSMEIDELCEFLLDEICDDCSNCTLAYYFNDGRSKCLGIDGIKRWLESEVDGNGDHDN